MFIPAQYELLQVIGQDPQNGCDIFWHGWGLKGKNKKGAGIKIQPRFKIQYPMKNQLDICQRCANLFPPEKMAGMIHFFPGMDT